MYDVVVVGTGIFGSVIAAGLRRRGHDLVTIDDGREGAGSRPAACLMKPSWFSGLGSDIFDPALRELDESYGVQDLRFRVGPGSATVHWIPPASILRRPDIQATVNGLAKLTDGWLVTARSGDQNINLYSRRVILATGVWARELCKDLREEVRGQAGVAFVWSDSHVKDPFISPWAPYRQLVAFNRGDGLWVGDGTSIKQENWSTERMLGSLQRCARAVDRDPDHDLDHALVRPIFGVRPYVKEKPCLLLVRDRGLWLATGGAKNGTLAAGWCAHQLGRALS